MRGGFFLNQQVINATIEQRTVRLIRLMKLKYLLKFLFFFLYQTFVSMIRYFIPYFIFIFWWAGFTGFVIWVLFCVFVSYGSIKEGWLDYRTSVKYEEGVIRQRNTPSARMNRFIQKHNEKAYQILNQIGIHIGKDFFCQPQDAIIEKSVSFDSIKTTKQVTNEERLSLVQEELENLKECNPSPLLQQIEMYQKSLDNFENDIIPLAPVSNLLQSHHINRDFIRKLQEEAKHLQQVYNEAKDYLEKEKFIMSTGMNGENRVNKELDMYEGIWYNFPNVRIEVNGQSAESDNIIVSTKGIFTVEVKNYAPTGNYRIHITKDGQWLKINQNGNIEPMNNVTSQMNYHIALKNKFFNEKWKEKYGSMAKTILIQPIFVIANDIIRIQNDTDLPIMRISNIYHHIMKLPDILTEEQVQQLCEIIRDNKLPPKKFEIYTYSEGLKNAYITLSQKIEFLGQKLQFIPLYIEESKKELMQYI